MWPVGTALAVIFAAAIVVAVGAFLTGWNLLGAHGLKPEHQLTTSTLFDLVKLSFGVVAGSGALVALVVAYRRQRVDEDGALREATRLHTEGFTTAVSQLGEDSPAVRLGGVHALFGLANDAPTQDLRQTCIDVLCAYLRLPSPSDPGNLPDGTSPSEEQRAAHRDKKDLYLGMREVRHTILRLIGDHYRIPEGMHRSWQGCNLDLTGVTIDGVMDFHGAVFSKGTVSFEGASISGRVLFFICAGFFGGEVSFRDATFDSDMVAFDGAIFSGGVVAFDRATFDGGSVSFAGATFSGSEVSFRNVKFSGGQVPFDNATGPVPIGLLDAVSATSATETVTLPPSWQNPNP
ncbi:pentapeptide repeat-containing protein [Streptomyces sp. Ag109_O5-10]|uniref:pentapeptide repeat-containing protein n=1 Tax=Streptomyces sp. Ag109_O5-10 TaxID=1855349 RepID=UPI00089551CC|nr:pentapeptide repeat-containing protein [Streptomyces sp. Ag109_O5-10]SED59621.1 Pentapeptide repeat-containing protein [Streptomyces sp. Ag109_O5-10]